MTRSECPKCGATMAPAMIGEHLKDKVLKCGHCGHTVDVPDEHEVRRVEERSLGAGRFERIETIERRRDLHGTSAGAGLTPLPPEIAKLLDRVGGRLKVVGPDGKSVDLPEGMKVDRVQFVQGDNGELTGLVGPDGKTIPLPAGWKPEQVHFVQGLQPGEAPALAELSSIPWTGGKAQDLVKIVSQETTYGTPPAPAAPAGPEFKLVLTGNSAAVVLVLVFAVLVGLVVLVRMLQ